MLVLFLCFAFLLMGKVVQGQDDFGFVEVPKGPIWGVQYQTALSYRAEETSPWFTHFITGNYNSLLISAKWDFHQVGAGPSLLFVPNLPENENDRLRSSFAPGLHCFYRYYLGYGTFPTEIFLQVDVRYHRLPYLISNVAGLQAVNLDLVEPTCGAGVEHGLTDRCYLNGVAGFGYRTRGSGWTFQGQVGGLYRF